MHAHRIVRMRDGLIESDIINDHIISIKDMPIQVPG